MSRKRPNDSLTTIDTLEPKKFCSVEPMSSLSHEKTLLNNQYLQTLDLMKKSLVKVVDVSGVVLYSAAVLALDYLENKGCLLPPTDCNDNFPRSWATSDQQILKDRFYALVRETSSGVDLVLFSNAWKRLTGSVTSKRLRIAHSPRGARYTIPKLQDYLETITQNFINSQWWIGVENQPLETLDNFINHLEQHPSGSWFDDRVVDMLRQFWRDQKIDNWKTFAMAMALNCSEPSRAFLDNEEGFGRLKPLGTRMSLWQAIKDYNTNF
jgi:hypothetical protein